LYYAGFPLALVSFDEGEHSTEVGICIVACGVGDTVWCCGALGKWLCSGLRLTGWQLRLSGKSEKFAVHACTLYTLGNPLFCWAAPRRATYFQNAKNLQSWTP
jgi:hypothetical protein